MQYFCIKTKQFRSVNLESVLPNPAADAYKIHPNKAPRRYMPDPWKLWQQLDEHLERLVVQEAFASHWATATQTPLVLVLDKDPMEVCSRMEAHQMRADASRHHVINQVVQVYGPLPKIETELGMLFMIMDVNGDISGC
jgi:hypothetical protein